jgi:dipeptidase E
VTRLLFVPYALHDLDAYTGLVRERVGTWGLEITGIHETPDAVRAVEDAPGLLMGGGNTFRLLLRLIEHGLVDPIRERVRTGMPYVGASAGSNVACPTIMTTNDMPIVRPPTFRALGLVPFQINPHYLDPDPDSTHQGETRETRIREYHEMNDLPVIGLREGSMLVRDDDALLLQGTIGARLFLPGREPVEHVPGDRLDHLLQPEA